MKTLVIGYGNPLRGDDAFGWTVVRQLAAAHATHPDVAFLTAHQLMPEHAEAISAADRVFFVDAATRGRPGTWSVREITAAARRTTFAHALDAAALLACAREIYLAHPAALLVSAPGASFACADGLTPSVAAVVPAVVAYLHGQLHATQTTPSHA